MIVEKSECFEVKINLELLSKYFPKFDQLSDSFPLITAYISSKFESNGPGANRDGLVTEIGG
ncbi:hypothetical protein BpHYR1_019121 [Brachionus plicatilis]|uniref:Uncharacterized protein n=1 Tax=Brachionus plicatilis TaxID=10195 RepID=A0A3M7SDR6_BRAPC|nr:hypothetical protein BpHYR1_019121 [Brachionus plicatilis]